MRANKDVKVINNDIELKVLVREIGRVLRDSPQPPRRNYPRGFDEERFAPGVASGGPSSARRPRFSNPDPPRRPEFTFAFDQKEYI